MPSEDASEPAPGLTVRPALSEDAPALAELYLASRAAAHPAIPHGVHPPEDVRRWVRTWFEARPETGRLETGRLETGRLETGRPETGRCEVWLAEDGPLAPERPVGLLLIEEDWLHSLYVAPGRTGEGVGSVLLELAKARRPHGLGLWVFETNLGARRFYARHGFVEVGGTDGSDNEEGAPDLELSWPGRPATAPA